MIPPAMQLVLLFAGGTLFGSLVNWAIYSFAWTPRPISPWSRSIFGGGAISWADRTPILGWLRLRREVAMHGRAFWVRPLLLELFLGAGLAWLFWWEVLQSGLVRGQAPLGVIVPAWPLYCEFFAHVLVIGFMLAASIIDIDEKIVPDEITVPGTVLGLMLATLAPLSLLPVAAERVAPPIVGAALNEPCRRPARGIGDDPMWLEPVTPYSPTAWPPAWADPRGWHSLVIALAIYLMWCFALVPRIWRGRRGTAFALKLIWARVAHEFRRPPLGWFVLGGLAWIAVTWLTARLWPLAGEPAWCGLVTSLVGLAGGGGLVWSVRLVGSAALRREAMGFGDVTLMMMIGTFLGWQACLFTFFLSPFAAVLIGVVQWILRRDNVLPFVPYLSVGAVVTIVNWATIWRSTQQVFALPALVPAVFVICLAMLGAMLAGWRIIKSALFRDESREL